MIKKIREYFKNNSGEKVVPISPLPENTRQSLKEAWDIINVLHMETMDNREPWPMALQWLSDHEEYR